jgi:hypothetical protein
VGRIVVSEFVSLDRVTEDPGGDGYNHGGSTVLSAEALLIARPIVRGGAVLAAADRVATALR